MDISGSVEWGVGNSREHIGSKEPGEAVEASPVREALAGLLADSVWASYFEKCCEEGTTKLDAELGRFTNALRSGGIRYRQEDVRLALDGLAREKHPESPVVKGGVSEGFATEPEGIAEPSEVGTLEVGATSDEAWREQVVELDDTVEESAEFPESDELPELDDEDNRVEIRGAKDVVAFLVQRCADDWLGYFENLCLRPESLRIAGGREFHLKSKKMGWSFTREEIEDALFELAHALYPDSPAGQKHAFYGELHRCAEKCLDEQGLRERLTAEQEAEHVERAFRAIGERDRTGYRRALREWLETARRGT